MGGGSRVIRRLKWWSNKEGGRYAVRKLIIIQYSHLQSVLVSHRLRELGWVVH